jgi:hypothetical protein
MERRYNCGRRKERERADAVDAAGDKGEGTAEARTAEA